MAWGDWEYSRSLLRGLMGGGGLPLTGHPSVLLLLLGLGLPPAVGLPLPNQAPIPEKIPTFVLEVGVAELWRYAYGSGGGALDEVVDEG